MATYKKVTPYKKEDVSKKQQVEEMFDSIAPRYDALNRVLSLRIDVIWRKKALALLKKESPQYILDIATGTGDLAIMAAKRLAPKKIVGLDISKEMLKVGDKKIAKENLTDTIELTHGDSENMPFETGSFDAVMAAFGVRNFETLENGLAEMQRVLKPGGTCMILEFSQPIFPIKQLFNLYFKYILPVIGKVFSKDPRAYKYLFESVQVFPDGNNFTNILKKVGFSEAKYKALTFGICTIYLAKK